MNSFIYVLLVLLTFATLIMGNSTFTLVLSIGILFTLTFLKGQFIIDHFMDLKQVRLGYRMIPTLWLAFVIGMILLAYFLPSKFVFL